MNSELKGAIIGGTIAAFVSAALTLAVNVYTDSISQHRQSERETVLTFSEKGFPLTDIGTKYIAAVISGKASDELKLSFRSQIAQEISTSERYRQLPSLDTSLIDDYQITLKDLSKALDGANSATEMSAWATAFGKANDAHATLDQALRRRIGV